MKAAVLILLCARGGVADWIKVTKRYCANAHGRYRGKSQAMQACAKSNPPCAGVFDPQCDNKGPFYLCSHGSTLKHAIISCVYQHKYYEPVKPCTCSNGTPVVGTRYACMRLFVCCSESVPAHYLQPFDRDMKLGSDMKYFHMYMWGGLLV